MEVTDSVAKAINAGVPENQLRKIARQEGMADLREGGLEKIRQGLTSVEEVLKRTVLPEQAMPPYLVNPDSETYEDGDVIIREGNRDLDFFELVQGSLYVVKQGKKIGEIIQPGEYFAEMSAISGDPRSATVISKGRSAVKRFPGDKFAEIIEKYPDIAKHLFKIIVTRLGHANGIIVKLANGRAQRKA
jgi:type IV pilus assembly protein PilB